MAALTLAKDVYGDKVLGAWQGKSIGVTFGAPMRGMMTPGRLNFYSPVPGQPAPSIALDFQVVWLDEVERAGIEVKTDNLGQAWLNRLDYYQDEYGYALLNRRRASAGPRGGRSTRSTRPLPR